MGFKCSKCKNLILKWERFCSDCGQPFNLPKKEPVKCRKCGHMEHRTDAKYCTRCGAGLLEPQIFGVG